MTFATIDTGGTFATRLAAGVIRPAFFLYLDWPSGEVRASTFHRPLTIGEDSWAGVGALAFIRTSPFRRSGALISYEIGLSSLPQVDIDDTVEAAAIGVRAELFMGLFATGWTDPVLRRVFIGHVISAGDFRHRRGEDGGWVTEASIEISNGRSPRRRLETHHSPETADYGDTAWRLLPTVGRAVTWPES